MLTGIDVRVIENTYTEFFHLIINEIKVVKLQRYSCHCDVRVLCTEGAILVTVTSECCVQKAVKLRMSGLSAGPLTNSADPDQTSQKAAYDQSVPFAFMTVS